MYTVPMTCRVWVYTVPMTCRVWVYVYCTYDVQGVGDGDGIAEDIQLAGVLTPVSLLYFRYLQPVLSCQAQSTVLPHQHPVQKEFRTACTVP